MTSRMSPLAVCLGLWALAACDTPAPSAAPTLRDSAGVTIVEIPTSVPTAEWSISDAVLAIGGLDDRPEYQLYNAQRALWLDHGVLVVANAGSHEVRLYREDGTHLRTVGGRGGGPGEYEGMWGLARLPGDSLGVWDWRATRLTVYDRDGELGRSVAVVDAASLAARLIGTFPDGSFAVAAGLDPMTIFARGGGPFEVPVTLLKLGPDGVIVDSLGPYPGEERFIDMGEGQFSIRRTIYGRAQRIEVAAGRIHAGDDRTGEVRVYDAGGGLRRVIRRAFTPEPVTDADVRRYRETTLAATSEREREAQREFLDRLPAARTLPAFSDLFVDRLGRIWLMEFSRETEGPRTWTVLAADGTPSGRLLLPRRVAPVDAGADYLLAWSLDDLDVERITLHELRAGDR
jgi:hypothetical protein